MPAISSSTPSLPIIKEFKICLTVRLKHELLQPVALATVKKRWASIYDRVAAVDPEVLLGNAEVVPPKGRRGPEKRRRLLAYVRNHLEELRPVNPLPS